MKTGPPVRTGDGQMFSEATQQVHERGGSRRMVGDSLHISLELPLRPLVTNSGSRTDHCRELGPTFREQYPGLAGPIAQALALLWAVGV